MKSHLLNYDLKCNECEKPVQRKPPKCGKQQKEATKQHKNDVADGHKNEAISPWRNPALEAANLQSSQKLLITVALAADGLKQN